MGQPDPRWAEAPEFNWIPDQPFRAESPPAAKAPEPWVINALQQKPAQSAPQPLPRPAPRHASHAKIRQHLRTSIWRDNARDGIAYLQGLAQSLRRPAAPQRHMEPRFDAKPFLEREATEWKVRPETQTAAAESVNSFWPARLMIGVLQGIGLAFLAKDQSISVSAVIMVFLFVPLLLLARLGPAPGRLLLPWTAITTFILGASGTYQYWRGGSLGGTAIALTAIALFAGQTLAMVWARNGKPLV